MPYESWLRHFHQCKLFNLTPFERNECVTNEDEWLRTRYIGVNGIWDCLVHEGRWVAGETAGGSGFYNKDKYWTNPQYSFNLDECDLIENDSCCAIISLIQINTRLSRLRQGLEPFEEFIKFRLFSVYKIQICVSQFCVCSDLNLFEFVCLTACFAEPCRKSTEIIRSLIWR